MLDVASMSCEALADHATTDEVIERIRAAGRLDELIAWLAKRPTIDGRLAYRIQTIGPEARACVPSLLRAFHGDDRHAASAAGDALVAIAPDDRSVAVALRTGWDDPRRAAAVRRTLVAYVETLPALADALLALLQEPYGGSEVIEGLTRYGAGPTLVAALARRAQAPAGLRVAARAAAGMQRHFPAALVARALLSIDEATRDAAIAAVLARARDTAAAAALLPEIIRGDVTPEVRYRALREVASARLDDRAREALLAEGSRLPIEGSIDELLASAPLVEALCDAARDGARHDEAVANARALDPAYLGAFAITRYASDCARGVAIVREAGRIADLVVWLAARPFDRAALELVRAIGPDAAALAPALDEVLASDDDELFQSAIHALREVRAIDDAALARIRTLLAGDGERARRIRLELAGLTLASPALVDDALALLADDDHWEDLATGIRWRGASPALFARADRDPRLAVRAAHGRSADFPVAQIERALSSPDRELRRLATGAVLERARDTAAATALLAAIYDAAGPGDPIRQRALRAVDAYLGDDFITSADGRYGAAFMLTRDRTSYREMDLSYEVVVFEAAFPRRNVESRHYSVFENASGRRGSAPAGIAFTDERTLEITLDDGTTETLYLQANVPSSS